jgi:hypothetical protein
MDQTLFQEHKIAPGSKRTRAPRKQWPEDKEDTEIGEAPIGEGLSNVEEMGSKFIDLTGKCMYIYKYLYIYICTYILA